MSTFKKIEKYEKIKKRIIILTVILVVLDTILAFASPMYLPSASSLLGLGFAGYHSTKEYGNYRIDNKNMSIVILLISLILAGFSVYYITLNLLNMADLLVRS